MEIRKITATPNPPASQYLLDNSGREAPARFAALSAMFDSGTIRHLEERGVAPGWTCWEVGGGGGSIAAWPTGSLPLAA